MNPNSSTIPPGDQDKTRMDIILSENARAMSENPRLFEEKTSLHHMEDRTVADIAKKAHGSVAEVIPAASSDPQIEATEMPEEEAALLLEEIGDEIPVTVELPLELLIRQEKLTGDDTETLLKYLQATPDDVRLWAFVDKVAPHPIDAQVVRANLAQLNADLLDSILVIGSHQETVTDELTGQAKTIYLYGGYSVAEGGLGEVAEVSLVEENNLQLRHSLIKLPLVATLRMNLDYLFVLEAAVGKKLRQLADLNPYDRRLKHVLVPEIIADTFMVIPRIINQSGKSQTLSEVISQESPSLARFAHSLSGMAAGLSFLSEYDIIAIDNKDSNYMESTNRGCLIDLGGFLPMESFKTGEVQIQPLDDGSDLPVFKSTGHNVPFTPSYSNPHLMSKELRGELPNDITHKLTMARVIEKYLTGYVKEAGNLGIWKAFSKKNSLEKLEHAPIDLAGIALSPAESRLYQLYLGLYNSHKHPYKYHQDDSEQGVDPKYLSLSVAEDILLEISKM